MQSSVTVSVRSVVLAAVAATAAVLAYLLGAGQAGAAVPAAAPAAPAAPPVAAAAAAGSVGTPQIVMTGSGEATGVPDQLRFSVSVRTTAADVSTALAQANRTTRDVLAAVRAQGVRNRDVQTTGLDIRATYDYSDDAPPVITGYQVSQNMSVLVRSLPDAGATISAATDAGGNAIRLHGVRLQVGDERGLLRAARADAMAEAQVKAAQYAEATGSTLGGVLLVTEPGGRRAQPEYAGARLVEDAVAASVPIRAGTAELDVTVSVVWSLEEPG